MIVAGSFEAVSLAIYGEYAKESTPLADAYIPKNVIPSEPFPIAKALDPSMARDPTHLSRQLLSLVSEVIEKTRGLGLRMQAMGIGLRGIQGGAPAPQQAATAAS